MPRCLVSLGSNLGERHAAFARAVEALTALAEPGTLITSGFRETEAVGGPSEQLAFLNAVASFSTRSEPSALLASLQLIEQSLKRERHARWAERSLDLDLLLYGEEVISTPSLRVPHPRMTFRPFVLEPACEIASDWLHPECDRTLAEFLPILELGREAVAVLNDTTSEVAAWVQEERPELPIETAMESVPPRLTIEGSHSRQPLGPSGPRLVLADCPREHWRDEVAAALECVWPTSA